MENTMRRMPVCIVLAAAGCLLFFSCTPARQIKKILRRDLFSIEYGTSETQLDLSSDGDAAIDMDMREGIFHISNTAGRKILRLSSYGDLLALYYDPAHTARPYLVQPVPETGATPQDSQQALSGRYAVPTSFVSPSHIAADSRQIVYVADRTTDQAKRVFDPGSGAYCDRIIRRFGKQGLELPYLGQEGAGGTPFPYITGIHAMEDDSLAVFSASETVFLAHHFDKDGNLLSALRLSRSSLPLPYSLSAADDPSKGVRIHANLDGIVASIENKTFGISLKIDYYREIFDPTSSVISQVAFAGSWIFVLDGASGQIRKSFNVAAQNEAGTIPELIGENAGRYFMLKGEDGSGAAAHSNGAQDKSRILLQVDGEGKVHARYRLEVPEGTEEMMAIKVSGDGYIYSLLKTEKEAKMVWWFFR